MNSQENTPHRYVYETLSEASNDLLKRGYTSDFYIEPEKDCLTCKKTSLQLSPEEFVIDEIHRFEGMSDPADEIILYAISSRSHDIKGMVINSFGADFSYTSSKIVEHLNNR